MKKVQSLVLFCTVIAFSMTSCSEELPEKKEIDLCSCFEKQQEMNAELVAAGEDEKMLETIENKFKKDREACEKLGEKMQKEMKDLSDQEVKDKFEKMSENCPAMKEAMQDF